MSWSNSIKRTGPGWAMKRRSSSSRTNALVIISYNTVCLSTTDLIFEWKCLWVERVSKNSVHFGLLAIIVANTHSFIFTAEAGESEHIYGELKQTTER